MLLIMWFGYMHIAFYLSHSTNGMRLKRRHLCDILSLSQVNFPAKPEDTQIMLLIMCFGYMTLLKEEHEAEMPISL